MLIRKVRILPVAFIAAAAFGITLLLSQMPFFTVLELKGLDLLFILRGPLPPPESVIIVAIDEASMAEIGQQWPWPRSLHAQLIQKLKQAGARAIGFDVLFSEPSQAAEDQAFARAVQESGNVVLVSALAAVDDQPLTTGIQAKEQGGLAGCREMAERGRRHERTLSC